MDTKADNTILFSDADRRELKEPQTEVRSQQGPRKIDPRKLIIYSEIMRPKFDE